MEADNLYLISYCVKTMSTYTCKYCEQNFNRIEETMGFENLGENHTAADF